MGSKGWEGDPESPSRDGLIPSSGVKHPACIKHQEGERLEEVDAEPSLFNGTITSSSDPLPFPDGKSTMYCFEPSVFAADTPDMKN